MAKTVRVDDPVYDRLVKRKRGMDSLSDVIRRVLDIAEGRK